MQIVRCQGRGYYHNPRELPSITPFYRVMLCLGAHAPYFSLLMIITSVF